MGNILGVVLWAIFIAEVVRFILALRLTEAKSGLKGDAHSRYRALKVGSSGVFLASVLATVLLASLAGDAIVDALVRGGATPIIAVLAFVGGLAVSAILSSKATALKVKSTDASTPS